MTAPGSIPSSIPVPVPAAVTPIHFSSGANQVAQAGSQAGAQPNTQTGGGRERFAADELAIVLSHYELGVIREVKEFPRGSRKAPKLLIDCDAGHYLLKRRARGRDEVAKVTFSHLIQLHLAARQFPLPHLIGTRAHNHSMMQHAGNIYELFEYIPGQGYPQTLDATREAGKTLALYHKLLEDFQSDQSVPPGNYHNAISVEHGLMHIPKVVGGVEAAAVCAALNDAYRTAAMRVEGLGFGDWPAQIVHADWHPGNMLFRDGRVVAVIDYDSSRLLPRVIDVANGALQFSILGGDEELNKWPVNADESRFKRFVKGYDEVVLLSQAEVEAIPWLMVEALIAEAVFPIAQTGSFSRFDGTSFLRMVQRKIAWLREHATGLVRLVSE